MSHTLHKPLTGRTWALVAALLVAFGIVVAAASPAHAHDELIGTDPAADSSLDALPAQLTLTFSAEIADDEGASVVEVTDAGGTSLAGGAPTVHDNVLTQPLAGEASGAVTVLWKVVSSDGHPISGEFSFTVAGAPAPTPTATATPAPTESETPTPTPTELTDDMTVDWGATLLANALPVLLGAVILGGAIVAILLAVRRRRPPSSPSGPGSEPPADH